MQGYSLALSELHTLYICMLAIWACNGEGQCFYYMETSYTIFTHVQWKGARGSTSVGLHVIVLQAPLNGDTVVWKFCVVVTVFKHLVKSKFSEFYIWELSDCIQVLSSSSSSSRFMYSSSRLFKCYKVNCVCFTRAIHYRWTATREVVQLAQPCCSYVARQH